MPRMAVRPLARSLKVYERFFVVEGSGSFPLDMLRYDSACPATEEDSAIAQQHTERRRVALVSRRVNDNFPTEARWRSFGWNVVGTYPERYEAERARSADLTAGGG
jgi:hypothetical protein